VFLFLTERCLSGLVGLALAPVARRIFVTGTSLSFRVYFGKTVCIAFYSLDKFHVPCQPNMYSSLVLLLLFDK